LWDGVIRHWNLENGELIQEMPGHRNAIMSAALSADGKRTLTGSSDTGSADNTMCLWQVPR
jgi:WD40 repeat protein